MSLLLPWLLSICSVLFQKNKATWVVLASITTLIAVFTFHLGGDYRAYVERAENLKDLGFPISTDFIFISLSWFSYFIEEDVPRIYALLSLCVIWASRFPFNLNYVAIQLALLLYLGMTGFIRQYLASLFLILMIKNTGYRAAFLGLCAYLSHKAIILMIAVVYILKIFSPNSDSPLPKSSFSWTSFWGTTVGLALISVFPETLYMAGPLQHFMVHYLTGGASSALLVVPAILVCTHIMTRDFYVSDLFEIGNQDIAAFYNLLVIVNSAMISCLIFGHTLMALRLSIIPLALMCAIAGYQKKSMNNFISIVPWMIYTFVWLLLSEKALVLWGFSDYE